MSKLFCAGIALLLVVGVTRAGDDPAKKAEDQGQYAFGVIRSLDVKDGVGTLTILGSKRKKDRPALMKFAVTKDTKFFLGGTYGEGDRPGKRGDPVDSADVPGKFGNTKFLWILFTGEGDNMTVTVVNVTA